MLNKPFTQELPQEAASTKKLLQIVPYEQWNWKPHEKSMTLGMLATHVAELPGWITMTLNTEELDFATWKYQPPQLNSIEELVQCHDKNVHEAMEALRQATDEQLLTTWKMRRGEQVFYNMARIGVIRAMAMNHFIHHRGQLTVFLRLLNIPIPGMYGPSADERFT
jgi:uncharacterized damage-inducible protein DinB